MTLTLADGRTVDTADLRKMEAEMTPGPWYDDSYRAYGPTPDADKRNGSIIFDHKHVPDEPNHADYDGIVAMRNAFVALLDAAEERERLRAEIDGAHNTADVAARRALELRTERDAQARLAHDTTDHLNEALAALAAARQRIAELEAALKPFANMGHICFIGPYCSHCRAAALLAKGGTT